MFLLLLVMAVAIGFFFFLQNPKMVMEQQRSVKVEKICDLILEVSNSTFHQEKLIERQYK